MSRPAVKSALLLFVLTSALCGCAASRRESAPPNTLSEYRALPVLVTIVDERPADDRRTSRSSDRLGSTIFFSDDSLLFTGADLVGKGLTKYGISKESGAVKLKEFTLFAYDPSALRLGGSLGLLELISPSDLIVSATARVEVNGRIFEGTATEKLAPKVYEPELIQVADRAIEDLAVRIKTSR